MSDDAPRPEPDRVEGAPHPRETPVLVGQEAAEAAFLDAFNSGRMHHGWLITGPRGVGKATLAWRIARFLLARPMESDAGLFGDAPPAPASLSIPADHPVARHVAAQSEGRLFVLRRAWDEERRPARLKTVITVDETRRLKNFFGLSATDGGRRVVIVDAADEMNPNAANALLKLLEEPPEGVVLLLVSHQPWSLLPTIRSRCRELRLGMLGPQAMAQALDAAGVDAGAHAQVQAQALAELSGGSVGEAIRLANLDGLALYRDMLAMFATLPRLDRGKALALADLAGRRGNEVRLDLLLRLLELFLARLARAGVAGVPEREAGPGEAALLARLSPDARAGRIWAEAHETLGARLRHGRAVNLDPAALVLDMVLKVEATAAPLAAA